MKSPHVTNNSGNNEWYTPAVYVEAAREAIAIFDTETIFLSSDAAPDGRPIGWSLDRRGMMGISWACCWTSDGFMHHHCQDEIHLLVERLEQSALVVSFNGMSFDVPLVEAVIGRSLMLPRHCDLMQIVVRGLGHRLSLDALAQCNLPHKKSGYGGHAPQLYRDGKTGSLAGYCARDVEITRDLYWLAISRGFLYAPEGRRIVTPARWLQAKGE